MGQYALMKNELTVLLIYLQFMTSLTPKDKGGITNRDVKNILIEASEFIKTASDEEVILKGPTLKEKFQEVVSHYNKIFPPKIPLEQISKEFNDLYLENQDIYSHGLEYAWLNKVMDCEKLEFPEDLPYHAKIGLGHHAGMGSIEEDFLIRDAFYLLILSEEAYETMHSCANCWKKSNMADELDFLNRILGTANQNVATYSRLCLLSLFSFVEAFVNSVGYDYSLKNQDNLDIKDIEVLQGSKKGRYLSLESKIEKFPSIIRVDKKTPIIISDTKQIKEPFKTFLNEIKRLRDSSVHYSPQKEIIWRKPDEWLNKAQSAAKICLNVAEEFWKACYPDRNKPRYLGELDYKKHIDIAKKRFAMQDIIKNEDDSNK